MRIASSSLGCVRGLVTREQRLTVLDRKLLEPLSRHVLSRPASSPGFFGSDPFSLGPVTIRLNATRDSTPAPFYAIQAAELSIRTENCLGIGPTLRTRECVGRDTVYEDMAARTKALTSTHRIAPVSAQWGMVAFSPPACMVEERRLSRVAAANASPLQRSSASRAESGNVTTRPRAALLAAVMFTGLCLALGVLGSMFVADDSILAIYGIVVTAFAAWVAKETYQDYQAGRIAG
ncbi:hypothetical protein [Microvirga massiliensis]|uniref:hypothetical protein n=1 Tax=Microvirga massiliensis TaxID=1033741 RepID=UPI00062BAEF8|nr:hypothetical protein [Microvirga massiliensis]